MLPVAVARSCSDDLRSVMYIHCTSVTFAIIGQARDTRNWRILSVIRLRVAPAAVDFLRKPINQSIKLLLQAAWPIKTHKKQRRKAHTHAPLQTTNLYKKR